MENEKTTIEDLLQKEIDDTTKQIENKYKWIINFSKIFPLISFGIALIAFQDYLKVLSVFLIVISCMFLDACLAYVSLKNRK